MNFGKKMQLGLNVAMGVDFPLLSVVAFIRGFFTQKTKFLVKADGKIYKSMLPDIVRVFAPDDVIAILTTGTSWGRGCIYTVIDIEYPFVFLGSYCYPNQRHTFDLRNTKFFSPTQNYIDNKVMEMNEHHRKEYFPDFQIAS